MHETTFWGGGDHQTIVTKATRSPPMCCGFGFPNLKKVQVLFHCGEGLEIVGFLRFGGRIAWTES
jgi:hypothetical protein